MLTFKVCVSAQYTLFLKTLVEMCKIRFSGGISIIFSFEKELNGKLNGK